MRKAKVEETLVEGIFLKIKTAVNKMPQVANIVSPFGLISSPYKGVSIVRAETVKDDVVLGAIQQYLDGLNEGETVLFAKTSEGFKATIVAKASGNIEFNGTGDFLVRFNALEQWVTEMQNTFNGHTHLYSPGPSPQAPTAITATPINTGISGSKAETLETS